MTEQLSPSVHDAGLAAVKESLLRQRAENEELLAQARATLDTLAEDNTLASGSLREVATSAEYQVSDAANVISQIDAALARINDETFGQCVKCGNAIPMERLELRPYATTCVPCSA